MLGLRTSRLARSFLSLSPSFERGRRILEASWGMDREERGRNGVW